MLIRKLLALTMFGFVLHTSNLDAHCQAASAQEPLAPTKPTSREESVGIEETVEGILRVTTEPVLFHFKHSGKAIPQGGAIDFVFRLKNETELAFEFDKIRIGCTCLTVKCKQKSVNPGEFLEMVVSYHSPKSRSLKYGFNINFMKSNKLIGYTSVGGPLNFTLAIQDSSFYESNGEISIWKIPVVTSHPVEPKRLRVFLGESLGDLVGEIIHEEEQTFVQITGPESALGLSGISGTIQVKEPVLGLEATALVTFAKTRVIRLSPQYARFVKQKKRPGWYSANFLVQAVGRKRNDGGNVGTTSLTTVNRIKSIKCSSEPKYDIEVYQKKLNDSLYRIDVFVKRKAENEENFSLNWLIGSDEGENAMECDCYFLEDKK